MPEIRFSKEDEWVRVEGDTATIGISNYAQEQLGDLVFVELPKVGQKLTKGGSAGTVESVKAASDVYSPISGEVIEVNPEVVAKPELVNQDAMGAGWFYKVRIADPAEIAELMTESEYDEYSKSR